MEKERARLQGLRDDALARRQKIDDEIAGIDKELVAFDAYEAAKMDKPARKQSTGSRRGSRQDSITALLTSKPGLSRGEILEALGLKGDKTAEQSISNALNNMKKAGKLTQQDGKYLVA